MAYQLSFFDAAGAPRKLQLLRHLLRSGSQSSDFCNLRKGDVYVNSDERIPIQHTTPRPLRNENTLQGTET